MFWKRSADVPSAAAPSDAVRDVRPRPTGVMPRHLQTWLLAGLTGALLLIILIAGHPVAPRRTASGNAAQAITALTPEQLHQYQEQLSEQEARLRKEMDDNQAAQAAAAHRAAPGRRAD